MRLQRQGQDGIYTLRYAYEYTCAAITFQEINATDVELSISASLPENKETLSYLSFVRLCAKKEEANVATQPKTSAARLNTGAC